MHDVPSSIFTIKAHSRGLARFQKHFAICGHALNFLFVDDKRAFTGKADAVPRAESMDN
jgi:hypothetical protein